MLYSCYTQESHHLANKLKVLCCQSCIQDSLYRRFHIFFELLNNSAMCSLYCAGTPWWSRPEGSDRREGEKGTWVKRCTDTSTNLYSLSLSLSLSLSFSLSFSVLTLIFSLSSFFLLTLSPSSSHMAPLLSRQVKLKRFLETRSKEVEVSSVMSTPNICTQYLYFPLNWLMCFRCCIGRYWFAWCGRAPGPSSRLSLNMVVFLELYCVVSLSDWTPCVSRSALLVVRAHFAPLKFKSTYSPTLTDCVTLCL